jgi:UDP-glucose 4-epimerase
LKILVTGGAGYIGSHMCVELLNAGHVVYVYDNLSTGHPRALERVQQICGKGLSFIEGDVRDASKLEGVLRDTDCEAVIHFAGLKAVGDSVNDPLTYYEHNVLGSFALMQSMSVVGLRTLVFSSSATVYGEPQHLPLKEDHVLAPESPYGRSKRVVEDMLRDLYKADPTWRISVLRYFNPVGAHPSGLIGEDPRGVPNNLMPFVAQVAVGRREALNVWGSDYPTPDGTGVRDYIHVVDLAQGHVKALERLSQPQCLMVNLGTGRGCSVLEVVKAFEEASGRAVPCKLSPRRPGDVASYYADPSLATELLGWRATRDLATMCRDHWRWQAANPQGYA